MKTFIVPTDFSDHSTQALTFAINMAKKLNAQLKLIHINIFLSDPNLSVQNNIQLMNEHTAALEGAMDTFKAMLSESGLAYETIIQTEAFVSEGIVECAKKYNANLIIMGSVGVGSSLIKKIMGSTACAVLDKASVPLIVIPNKKELSTIKELLFVSAWDRAADRECLRKVYDLASKLNLGVKVLTIKLLSDTTDIDKKLNDITTYIKSEHITASIDAINAISLEEAIRIYTSENEDSLVCMSTRKRGMIEKLWSPSPVTHLVKNIEFPIMVFPVKK